MDDMDQEVLDLLDLVIASAPICEWPETATRRQARGRPPFGPTFMCGEPATWSVFDVCNYAYRHTCDECRKGQALLAAQATDLAAQALRRNPDIRLSHADALLRVMAKRERLRGA